jgi:hypothetical protein
MPYIVSFAKPIAVPSRDAYINECCVGGDVVLEQLMPTLRQHYGEDVHPVQEDWGWFAWFEHEGVKLAVDVHTDDPDTGEFQIHLTSRRPRRLFGAKVEDTPELERLREHVVSGLHAWGVAGLLVERVDEQYRPL